MMIAWQSMPELCHCAGGGTAAELEWQLKTSAEELVLAMVLKVRAYPQLVHDMHERGVKSSLQSPSSIWQTFEGCVKAKAAKQSDTGCRVTRESPSDVKRYITLLM